MQFHFTELHYRIVIPSTQVKFKVATPLANILVHRLHLYVFLGYVLAIFDKSLIWFLHYFALFALSAKYRFSNFEGHKAFY